MTANEQVKRIRELLDEYEAGKIKWSLMTLEIIHVLMHGYIPGLEVL